MSTVLEQLRQRNVRQQKEAKEAAGETPAADTRVEDQGDKPGDNPEGQPYDSSYTNMTSQQGDNQESNTEIQQDGQMESRTTLRISDKPTGKTAGRSAGKKAGQQAVQQAGPSVRDMIRATVQQADAAGAAALKTVTLKLPPDLDKRVEDHCYHTGRKKQDVVRDAILLYFEVVEGEGE